MFSLLTFNQYNNITLLSDVMPPLQTALITGEDTVYIPNMTVPCAVLHKQQVKVIVSTTCTVFWHIPVCTLKNIVSRSLSHQQLQAQFRQTHFLLPT
ncbi:hypothetical protein Zmor_026635 [Zophobas morio]|uniref:Uncharacterized protein n=1 Tax=Zophobas morio TaxID=2755281 RepID=A0AA38M4L4_9CUCU|nr:hypothetical protein Zmor_026635 [Zophobas morio]